MISGTLDYQFSSEKQREIQSLSLFFSAMNQIQEERDNPLGFNRNKPNNKLPSLQSEFSKILKQLDTHHFDDNELFSLVTSLGSKNIDKSKAEAIRLAEAKYSNLIESINDHQSDTELASIMLEVEKGDTNFHLDRVVELQAKLDVFEKGIRKRTPGKRTVIANRDQVVYTPPDNFKKITHLLSDWNEFHESFCNSNQIPLAMYVGLSHYQFESILPFYDGNGRVGRVLAQKLLAKALNIQTPILISKALYENRKDYYKSLNAPRLRGDYNALCEFFNRILYQAITDTVDF